MALLFVDTHSHLQDEAFNADREAVLERCEKEGLAAVINAGTDLESTKAALDLAGKKAWMWALAGFHPHDASKWRDDSLPRLENLLSEPKVLGVGEIGLDYHYDHSPREVQKEVFLIQWDLAARLKAPAVIHLREAFDDFFDLIKGKAAPPRVILHCFSGNLEVARKALDLDFSFSIGGPITFSKNEEGRSVFRFLPVGKIHLETDCPYLAPEPFRGKRCEPAHVIHSFRKMVQIRKEDQETLAQKLLNNALAFFGPKLQISQTAPAAA